ncbi:fasciclin domain-containing protein [Nonomuraea corallina]|uniref:fasciclin domain-containing protein n=1 Tax=Nonomuraea corallina TaxID=2989783 RepID=UPI002FD7D14F
MKRTLLAAGLALTATVAGTTGAFAASPAPSPSPSQSLVGTGCSAIENKVSDLADQPVGTALGQVPELSALAEAVKQAGLADKLNSAEGITVFAPTNEAFEAVPQEQRDQLMSDKEQLTKILQYHVVEGKKAPDQLTEGPLTTLQGGDLTVEKSGESYTVNGATVACGNVQTRNATVYVIDQVLTPQ